MTPDEAIEKLSAMGNTKEIRQMIATVRRLGRVLPWIENEIKFAKVECRTYDMGTHGVCDAAVQAERNYNGGFTE